MRFLVNFVFWFYRITLWLGVASCFSWGPIFELNRWNCSYLGALSVIGLIVNDNLFREVRDEFLSKSSQKKTS